MNKNEMYQQAVRYINRLNARYPDKKPYRVTHVGNRRIFIARLETSPLDQCIFSGKTNADALIYLRDFVEARNPAKLDELTTLEDENTRLKALLERVKDAVEAHVDGAVLTDSDAVKTVENLLT